MSLRSLRISHLEPSPSGGTCAFVPALVYKTPPCADLWALPVWVQSVAGTAREDSHQAGISPDHLHGQVSGVECLRCYCHYRHWKGHAGDQGGILKQLQKTANVRSRQISAGSVLHCLGTSTAVKSLFRRREKRLGDWVRNWWFCSRNWRGKESALILYPLEACSNGIKT